MNFSCSHVWEDGSTDKWEGNIDSITNYGAHYELVISSRSSINLIIGIYSKGIFAVAPRYGGTYLSNHLDDVFYNTELLSRVFDNIVDGVTAAKALAIIADQVKF